MLSNLLPTNLCEFLPTLVQELAKAYLAGHDGGNGQRENGTKTPPCDLQPSLPISTIVFIYSLASCKAFLRMSRVLGGVIE